jgi:hypothetical protein
MRQKKNMETFQIVSSKKQLCKTFTRVVLEIYGGKEMRGEAISDFKFHYCHKITKLIKKRILHDTTALVTTPQEHQVG